MSTADASYFLEKVLRSTAFSNKEVLKGLLSFLYEASKKEVLLKEADIAGDYFKRAKDFVPGDDTIVRVNVHKLRMLLEQYYAGEGKKDDLVFEIPKGSYVLNYTKRKSVNRRKSVYKRIRVIVLIILGISIVLNIYLAYQVMKNNGFSNYRSNPVWSGYIKSKKPVFITLADPFFFRTNDSVSQTVMRDLSVNSIDDLKKSHYNARKEEKSSTSGLLYPYFTTNNVWPLPDILSVFAREGVEVRLQALSQMNIEETKRNNEIFIGNINSFGFMNRFLDQTSIRLHTDPRQIVVIRPADSLVLSVPENIHGYYIDYAFLVKVPGPNDNLITLMGDFHASGIKGLSNYISKPGLMGTLEKRVKKEFGGFPDFFEMVVKVISYNYSDFKTEVIYFKPLQEKNSYFN